MLYNVFIWFLDQENIGNIANMIPEGPPNRMVHSRRIRGGGGGGGGVTEYVLQAQEQQTALLVQI